MTRRASSRIARRQRPGIIKPGALPWSLLFNRLLLFPLIYAVVRLFGLTYRFRSRFPAVAADAAIQSYVLAIWHQNLFSGILAPGAVTVDGPRGPAHQVKPGIIEMARLAGVPVVPYLTLAQRYWTFRSWDAFRLPKPFTRVEVCYGAPIPIPPDTAFDDFAGYQQRIADALQALEIEAQQRLLTP